MRVARNVAVRIPAGVDEQCVMRVRGVGDGGRWGGPPGDLLLRFQVCCSFFFPVFFRFVSAFPFVSGF